MDLNSDLERLKAAGATVVQEPYGMGDDHMRIGAFADPDGNHFQLVSPL